MAKTSNTNETYDLRNGITAVVKGSVVIATIPLDFGSGRTPTEKGNVTIASTGGASSLVVDGKIVKVGINAFYKP